MQRIIMLLLLSGVMLTACGGVGTPEQVSYGTQYPTATAPIATVPPTATIDHAMTAQIAETQLAIAQATSNEASRLNTQATAEFEQRQQAQLQMTADAERQLFAMQMLTATMAGTSIPLTATQQAVLNTQIPAQQQLMVAQITQTSEAPQKLIEMSTAVNVQKYGFIEYLVRFVFFIAVAYLFVGLGAWLLRRPAEAASDVQVFEFSENYQPVTVVDDAPVQPKETIVIADHTDNLAFASTYRYSVPCTPDQLTELAEKILAGETLGINQWEERKGRILFGKTFAQVRSWAQLNHFTVSAGGGQLAPTDTFKAWLNAWLNTRELPTEYQFQNMGDVA